MRLIAALGLACTLAFSTHSAYAGDSADNKPQNYVYLKPLMLPVMSHGGDIEQFISVTVTLELDDAATASKVHDIAPRIVDAYLQDLYGAIGDHRVIRGGLIDPMALKAELESSNTRVLGTIPCKVLLQNIGQRAVHENSAS